MGITPQGVINYISKAWGECPTLNCGFLDNLLPGEIVMADRGLDVEENVALYCAKVKIPSFT